MIARLTIAAALAAAAPAFALDYDDRVDGDFSNDELNPTMLGTLDLGSNMITGNVGGSSTVPPTEFFDAFTFTVAPGEQLDDIILDSYVTTGGNTTSGFNVSSGQTFDGFTAPNFLGSVLLSAANVGTDLLNADLTDGLTDPLPAGDYTVSIREGTPNQTYGLSLNVSAIPEPASLGLLAVGGLALVRRRRA